MLVIENPAYHEKVMSFAWNTGQAADLKKWLDYLDLYAGPGVSRCRLYKDFAPYSYTFVMERRKDAANPPEWKFWFNGGLIYHGAHDGHGSGAAPTLAVTLTPTDGWSIHT